MLSQATTNSQKANALTDQGNTYYQKNDFKSAAICFQQAIEIDPSLARAHHNLGRVYESQEKFLEAIETYNAAILLDPKYAKVYFRFSIIYLKLNQIQKSKEALTKAIELNAELDKDQGVIKHTSELEKAIKQQSTSEAKASENRNTFFASSAELEIPINPESMEILENIAKNGLIPARLQRNSFVSADGYAGHGLLCFNRVDLTKSNKNDIEEKLKHLAWEDDFSQNGAAIWAILLERAYKLSLPEEELLSEMGERLASSMVVLFKPPAKEIIAEEKPIYHDKDLRMEKPLFKECRTSQKISSDDFLGIVVPCKLEKVASKLFPNIKIYPVDNKQIKTVLNEMERLKYPRYFTKSKRHSIHCEFNGPDYLAGLSKFVTATNIKVFGCHAVRLFTKRDLKAKSNVKLEDTSSEISRNAVEGCRHM